MKPGAILTGVFVLVLAVAAPAPAQQADSATAVLVRQAHSLEVKGRLDMAAQNWRRVLLADPDNGDALAGLARIAKSNGDVAEAERQLTRLRAVQPNHPAIRRIESMKPLASQMAELNRAARLASEQQYEGAMEVYRAVFGSDPIPGNWAITYYETSAALPGGWETAVTGLRKLVSEFPGVQEYQLSLGRVLSYRPATRVEGMQLLENIKGDDALANRARQAWRQALIWQGPASTSLQSLHTYIERYPDKEIEALRDQARTAQPAATIAGRREEELAFEALKENRLAEAEELFQKAQRLGPENPGPLSGLGFVRMKQDRFSDAIPFFEEALARRPNDKVIQEALESARFFGWMNKADASFRGSFFAEAAGFYENALEVRPDSTDALRGKAGSLMQLQRSAEAAEAYERLTQLDPRDVEAWKSLLRARYQSGGSPQAWIAYQRMPEPIRMQLGGDLDHLLVMASIYDDLKRRPEFNRAFQQAMEVAGAADTRPSLDQRMELGALLLKVGRFAEAATEFEAVVSARPENPDAWDGLLAALAQTGNDVRSLAVLGRMPEHIYQAALRRPGFLLSAAAIYRSGDKLNEAEEFLKRALAASVGEQNDENRLRAKLQLARVWIEQGNPAPGERMLRQLAAEHNENPEVWTAYLSALHEAGRDHEVMAESQRIPAVVMTRLLNEPNYVALLASVHNSRGEYTQGIRLVQQSIASLQADKQAVDAELQIQLAWLLLNSGGDPRELYSLLRDGIARPHLTKKERDSFLQIWSIWSRRSAEEALAAGDVNRAVAILSTALRMLPEDNTIYSALAGALVRTGQTANAFVVYKTWGLKEGNAADYAGAIGSAMTVNDRRQTSLWLREGLSQWPTSSQLLTLAGKDAAMRGDYDKAQFYWKSALEVMPENEQATSLTSAGATPTVADHLGTLLLGGQNPEVDATSPDTLGALLAGNTIPADAAALPVPGSLGIEPWNSPANQPVGAIASSQTQRPYSTPPGAIYSPAPYSPVPRSGVFLPPPDLNPQEVNPALLPQQVYGPPSTNPLVEQQMALVRAEPRSAREEVEDQIAAIEARNTPYIGSTGRMTTRSGRTGLEAMTVQEAEFDASTTLGNRYRLSLIARPVFLDAGTPEADNVLRLGLAPLGADIGNQSASGTAAELQFAGEMFGLKIGTTPNGFLVRNPAFGLRLSPSGGPVTAIFERDSVKDTLLSYAGTRDPISNQIFGGVISDTMTLKGDW
jgi:tetratricopeptide (TPR) repeat protein